MMPIRESLLMPTLRTRIAELERGVQRTHSVLDGLLRHVAGDLDRRGRDDSGLDAELAQRGEGLRGDAGMALHAGADDGDLAEVVLGAPADAHPVERPRSGRPVLD